MLVLTRRPGETLLVGDHIRISVVSISGNQVQIGIDAPRSVSVVREELFHDWSPREVSGKSDELGAAA